VTRRVLEDIQFFVHLPVEKLHAPLRGAVRIVGAFDPGGDDIEPCLASGTFAEEGGIERHFSSSGRMERKPAWRSTSSTFVLSEPGLEASLDVDGRCLGSFLGERGAHDVGVAGLGA
jgi:hypothetical protein